MKSKCDKCIVYWESDGSFIPIHTYNKYCAMCTKNPLFRNMFRKVSKMTRQAVKSNFEEELKKP